MALQGSYTFKGIVLSEAYVMVSIVQTNKSINSSQNLVSAATYNSDGTQDQEAVYETIYSSVINCSGQVKIYKDAAAKTANPKEFLTSKGFSFIGDVSADADNAVIQAYTHLKTLDEYDGYTDV
jgi:hypothetical protein